jgi:hypothetical protein
MLPPTVRGEERGTKPADLQPLNDDGLGDAKSRRHSAHPSAGVVWLSLRGHGAPFTNACFPSGVV